MKNEVSKGIFTTDHTDNTEEKSGCHSHANGNPVFYHGRICLWHGNFLDSRFRGNDRKE